MSNLLTRALTGIVIVGGIVGLLLLPLYGTGILVLLVSLFGAAEILKMLKKDVPYIHLWRDAIILAIFPVLLYLISADFISPIYLLSFILIPGLYFVLLLFTNYTIPFNHFSVWTGTLVYWVLPASLWLIFPLIITSYSFAYNDSLVLTLFIIIWTSDTMAYVTGSMIGKTKLFERVSPKKTWEGLLGAVVFASLAGYLIGLYFGEHEIYFAIRGAGIAMVGTMGDLVESILKRSMKVKDSGSILPGHGGVLDRFDAIVFTSPFVLATDFIYFVG